jgi:hypothetical protein
MSDKAEDPRTTIAWPSTRAVAPKLRDEAQGWPPLSAICSAREGKPIALKRRHPKPRQGVRTGAKIGSGAAAVSSTPAIQRREA